MDDALNRKIQNARDRLASEKNRAITIRENNGGRDSIMCTVDIYLAVIETAERMASMYEQRTERLENALRKAGGELPEPKEPRVRYKRRIRSGRTNP